MSEKEAKDAASLVAQMERNIRLASRALARSLDKCYRISRKIREYGRILRETVAAMWRSGYDRRGYRLGLRGALRRSFDAVMSRL